MNIKRIITIILMLALLAASAVNIFFLIETEKENRAYEAAELAKAEAEARAKAETEAEAARIEAEARAEAERIEAGKEAQYEKAVKALEAKDYEEAYQQFLELGDYRDSADYAANFFILREGTGSEPLFNSTERALFRIDGQLLWSEARLAQEPETLIYRSDRDYDEVGRLLRQVFHSYTEGTVSTMDYDAAGNIIARSIETSETGEISEAAYENVFYESGILQQQTLTVPCPSDEVKGSREEEEEELNEIMVYHYDTTGTLISADLSLLSGEFLEEYVYNQQGDLLMRKRTPKEGASEYLIDDPNKEFHFWTYDEKGNILKDEQYNGVGDYFSCYTYAYADILGTSIQTESIRYDINGHAVETYRYTAHLVYGPDME